MSVILAIKLEPTKKKDLTDDEKVMNCCLCLENLVTKGNRPIARLLPCSHLFHEKCIVKHITALNEIDDDIVPDIEEPGSNPDHPVVISDSDDSSDSEDGLVDEHEELPDSELIE